MQGIVKQIIDLKGDAVETSGVETSLLDCAQLMLEKAIGSLVILDKDKIVGILYERDIVRIAVTQGKDMTLTKVGSIMAKKIPIVSPDTTVVDAMGVITNERVRHLPVMEGDNLCGLISIGDITKWLLDSQQQDIKHLVNYIQGDYDFSVDK